jgi:hypothetical protein
MKDLIVHKINIAHYRLIELAKLADQAKPFYDWIEKHAKIVTGSHKSFNDILMNCSKDNLSKIIQACYLDAADEKPFLFDGIGRVYSHSKACFYFFAWIIRDAPQQRLSPLISRMQKADDVTKLIAETDSLTELIFEYRSVVKNFEWATIREIVIDRLEGSRRSISGHHVESNIRTGLITAIQNFFSIYNNYGKFKKVEIADKQIKVGRHTVDVSAKLYPKNGSEAINLLIPVKTRETEGGGHSHIFSRDILSAITDIKKELDNYHIAVIIVAENWSVSEISTITNEIDQIFHFNMSPNKFHGFDDDSQITLNKYIENILKGRI